MTIGLEHMEAFIAVESEGSQAKAAAKLGCTQSSVSKKLTALSGWLRKPLWTYDAPQQLTPEGRDFLPIAKQIVDQLYGARARLPITSHPKKPSARDIQV